MKIGKSKFIISGIRFLPLVFIFTVFPLFAMDWPSTDGLMTGNFGRNDLGRPSLGSVYESEGPVLAVESGELIFFRKSTDNVSALPSPLGTWAVLDHGDGLLSIYSRLENENDTPPLRIERNSRIADSGISGWSVKKGFYFFLYDRHERRWVNPSMIITPLPDTQAPQISSVELKDSNGVLINASGLRNLSQGRYTIIVSVFDTRLSQREQPLAPHRIICSVNGTEIGVLDFETITAKNGELLVNRNGLEPAKKIFVPFPAYEAGDVLLSRGQANLEIIVRDISGNTRSFASRFQVE